MSPKGNTRAVSVGLALSLCERGEWREASELIADAGAESEAMLIQGCVLFFTQPEAAKDVLSKASRCLPEGELREKANLWLAACYWTAGEAREARAVLDSIRPSSDAVRFLIALNASIFEATKLKRSLVLLSSVENLVDSVPDLYKAKFYNQRGWLMRRLKNIDEAIIDYEEARYLFERADAPRYLAGTTSNLAGLLVDAKRFDEAHRAVDSAIKSLPVTDKLYLAQVYDQKALILIAENKYVEAKEFAGRSVSLLGETENRLILAESLITHSKVLRCLDQHVDALNGLEQARRIAQYLGNRTVLLAVIKEEKETAHGLTQKAHVELVQTALDLSGGCLRGAARLVGVSVQPLDRFIRLHGIKRHPKVRKSIITKPRN